MLRVSESALLPTYSTEQERVRYMQVGREVRSRNINRETVFSPEATSASTVTAISSAVINDESLACVASCCKSSVGLHHHRSTIS